MIYRKSLLTGALIASLALTAIAATEKTTVKKPNYFTLPSTWKTADIGADSEKIQLFVGPLTPSKVEEVVVEDQDTENESELESEDTAQVERPPVINVMSLGEVKDAAEAKKAFKDNKTYRKERGEFLKSIEGEALEFFPSTTEIWDSGVEAYSHGYRYRAGSNVHVEYAHFVICKNKQYLVQTLASNATSFEQGDEMNEIVRSFQCE